MCLQLPRIWCSVFCVKNGAAAGYRRAALLCGGHSVCGAVRAGLSLFVLCDCACAAAGMMLFQIALNVFGITDLLPLTGVTLPFISRGGSSMICVWGLFAFIKAADVRTYPKINRALDASFSKQKQGLSATL